MAGVISKLNRDSRYGHLVAPENILLSVVSTHLLIPAAALTSRGAQVSAGILRKNILHRSDATIARSPLVKFLNKFQAR